MISVSDGVGAEQLLALHLVVLVVDAHRGEIEQPLADARIFPIDQAQLAVVGHIEVMNVVVAQRRGGVLPQLERHLQCAFAQRLVEQRRVNAAFFERAEIAFQRIAEFEATHAGGRDNPMQAAKQLPESLDIPFLRGVRLGPAYPRDSA